MMLYLPWLPLNEGVGFDLEITPPDGETELNDSKLTVLIQTKILAILKVYSLLQLLILWMFTLFVLKISQNPFCKKFNG